MTTADLPAPSPEAISASRDMVYEYIVETAELAESYARSLGEAAWRGDRLTVEVHLRQIRACVLEAIGAYKTIENGGSA